MKKIYLTIAALFAAAFFVSCSNSSDSQNLLPFLFPPNDFNGKTFTAVMKAKTKMKLSFTNRILTMTSIKEKDAVANKNTAYILESVVPYSYTYNSTTQQVIYKYSGSGLEERIIRNGKTTVMTRRVAQIYKDDADFVKVQTARNKALYDLYDDSKIADLVKNARVSTFKKFGYDDDDGATAVSSAIIEKYNKDQEESEKLACSLSAIYVYELSDTALKIKDDSRVPAGKSLKEIFDNYAIVMSIGGAYSFRKKASTVPDIVASDSSIGYKVLSVTDNAINVLGEMTTNASGYWVLANNAQSFKYTTTKTADSAVFEVETLGTINVDYASADNVPDMADAVVCSLE